MTIEQPDLSGVDLTALGIDNLELVEIDPEALEAAYSGTRMLDMLTQHLVTMPDEFPWQADEATTLVHLLEDPDLPEESRDTLVNRLADQIHIQNATRENDPFSLWAIGDSLFNVNYTAPMNTNTRVRLARAVSGYSPDRRATT